MKFRSKKGSATQIYAVVAKDVKHGSRNVAQIIVQIAKKFRAKYWGSLRNATPEMRKKLSPKNPELSDF